MAEDCRLSTALPSHPKTLKLERRLGDAGCWALTKLFLWAAGNKSDGDLGGMSDEEIELSVRWGGESGAFVRALVEVRFLDGATGSYAIHDWDEHNPWAAARGLRIEAARKAAAVRWQTRGEAPVASDSDAVRMPVASGAHADRNAGGNAVGNAPTQPNPTQVKTSTSKPNGFDQPRSSSKRKNQEPSREAVRLAALLKAEILRNKPDFNFRLDQERSWAVAADRMLRLDHRKPEQVADLIRWVQHDEFWMSNVLSMDTLRDKFDQLELRRVRSGPNGKAGVPKPPAIAGSWVENELGHMRGES
jgi:hypothetical protein